MSDLITLMQEFLHEEPFDKDPSEKGFKIRFAEVKKDAGELARLFSQQSTLPHYKRMIFQGLYKIQNNIIACW